MTSGFIKLQRGEPINLLLEHDHKAFVLLTVIALRARYADGPNMLGLSFGQAVVGDLASVGLTPKEYRCAKRRLERLQLATFTGSRRGTIATLTDSRIFSLRDEREWGDHKGEPISEHDSEKRANAGAGKGQAEGKLGATNQKERSSEGQNQSCAVEGIIFDAYPRKQARALAVKAIRAALKDRPPDQLLERTRAFAEATSLWPEADHKFIPYPATWFSRGSYDDDPATWARNGAKEAVSAEFQKF
jgi:hypothetical protein